MHIHKSVKLSTFYTLLLGNRLESVDRLKSTAVFGYKTPQKYQQAMANEVYE